MIKRQQYMNGNVSHDEYYRQFATQEVLALVRSRIGEKAIRKSKDPEFFNDIQLHHWDAMHSMIGMYVGLLLGEANGAYNSYSLSDTVCVGKAAARMIKETLDSPTP